MVSNGLLGIYLLVNVRKKNDGTSPFFYGKTRDFHWVIFNSSVSLPEGNTMKNPSILVGKRHEHGICNWERDVGHDMGMQKWMSPVWRFTAMNTATSLEMMVSREKP